MALAELQIGPQLLSNGVKATARGTKEGSAVVQDAHARFQQAVLDGNCYMAADTAGRAVALASATAPVGLTLYNPIDSSVNLVLWWASLTTTVVSGGICVPVLTANTNSAAAIITAGTALVPTNCLLSNKRGAGQVWIGTTLPAAPTIVHIFDGQATGAVTTTTNTGTIGGWFDGSIILQPNTAVSFGCVTTAGAAAGLWGQFKWEEISRANS